MSSFFENEIAIEGSYHLMPRQYSQPISIGASGQFCINNELYQRNVSYPENPKGELITQYLNGYGIALSSFTPVRYNPLKNLLSYYQSVLVKITTQADDNSARAMNNLNSSEKNLKILKSFIQNTNTLDSYPVKSSLINAYQVLLITNDNFKDKFSELESHYRSFGLSYEIATVEDIIQSSEGIDSPEKIRNYIIQEYQQNNIEYVVLAGDKEIVPYRGFYCEVQSSSVYTDDNIPSDLYYAALDGSWNDDGDNLWGEIGEDDLLPEIGVGRITFSNETDLHNILHKITSYQHKPVLGELQKPFMTAEHLWDDPLTYGGDLMDMLIGNHDENGYSTIGIPENFDIQYMYDRDLGNWSKSQLISKINEGTSFIHHMGHSNGTYNMRMSNSDITNSKFNMINGVDHNYTLVYTEGCICGAFDQSDCIAERMLEIENFVVAGAYNSRYGWFNEGQTEGPSLHLHREFVNALYSDNENHIGLAHTISRIKTVPWVTAPGQHEEGALRWCFYDCNIFGDPTLAIWTYEPKTIEATWEINESSTAIQVNINSVDATLNDLCCTVVNNEKCFGMGLSNGDGIANISFDEPITDLMDIELVVSGQNIVPLHLAISPFTNINEQVLNSLNAKLYFDGSQLNIKLLSKQKDQLNIQLFNAMGQQITVLEDALAIHGNYSKQYNLPNLKSGIYYCRLQNSYGNKTYKLLK